MSDISEIVELKIQQHNVADRLDKQDEINKANDYRFETMQRLIDEQNEFLAGINVTLNKLKNIFETTMNKFDRWVQRVIGATVAIVIGWALFSDDPISRLQWVLGLFT